MIRKIAAHVKRRVLGREGQTSYSQCGEDIIVGFALAVLGKDNPRYLDLGANDPVRLNNTYRLYRHGFSGACVEPNPVLAAKLRRKRPRDLCVEAAVAGTSRGAARFFVLDPPELSTFVEEEAMRRQRLGVARLVRELSVPLISVSELIDSHVKFVPDFVSLDIEGMDIEVIRSWDFERHRPALICVETLTNAAGLAGIKIDSITNEMRRSGYEVFADTYINTIYLDANLWEKGRQVRIGKSECG